MNEKFLDLKQENDFEMLDVPAQIINDGGIVLFPTETVYGIGANGLDDLAVKKIFLAKGRAQDNPLILHISDMDMLESIVDVNNITELEYKLMNTFWPGPFTIILNKKPNIANVATCGGDTVGVRMPSNRIAHELIKRAGVPIAAPSANISGKPSGTNVKDIFDELHDKVDFIIDGGDCDIGLESTVVRVIGDKVKILRPGRISKEDIEKVINDVEVDEYVMKKLEAGQRVLSPGMKYRHYAPKTKCILVYSEDNEKLINKIKEIRSEYKSSLVLVASENISKFQDSECMDLGSKENLYDISKRLFENLRKIDEFDVDVAVIEGVPLDGIGLAIMNRLIRACEYNYIVV